MTEKLIITILAYLFGSVQPSTGVQPSGSTLPWLCDLDGGRYCKGCNVAACPQGDSGALCCEGGICREWFGGACPGLLGWCNNYTVIIDPATGARTAECHD